MSRKGIKLHSSWTQEDMKKALKAIRICCVSIQTAARDYGVEELHRESLKIGLKINMNKTKIGKSKIMVAEIRPLKIQVTCEDRIFKTTKWMNFHIWEEVYKFINNTKEEYEKSCTILKPQSQTWKGKFVTIMYRFAEYEGCSTKYLNHCDQEFTDDNTKKKDREDVELVPTAHSLIISVSPQKAQSRVSKYTIAHGVTIRELSAKYTRAKLKQRLKEELGYLSHVPLNLSSYSSVSSVFDQPKVEKTIRKDCSLRPKSQSLKNTSSANISPKFDASGLKWSEESHCEFFDDTISPNDSTENIETDSLTLKNGTPTLLLGDSMNQRDDNFKLKEKLSTLKGKAKRPSSPVFESKKLSTSFKKLFSKDGEEKPQLIYSNEDASAFSLNSSKDDFQSSPSESGKASKQNHLEDSIKTDLQPSPEIENSIPEFFNTPRKDTVLDSSSQESEHYKNTGLLFCGSPDLFEGFPADDKHSTSSVTKTNEKQCNEAKNEQTGSLIRIKRLRSYSSSSEHFSTKMKKGRKNVSKNVSHIPKRRLSRKKSIEKPKKVKEEESSEFCLSDDYLPDLMSMSEFHPTADTKNGDDDQSSKRKKLSSKKSLMGKDSKKTRNVKKALPRSLASSSSRTSTPKQVSRYSRSASRISSKINLQDASSKNGEHETTADDIKPAKEKRKPNKKPSDSTRKLKSSKSSVGTPKRIKNEKKKVLKNVSSVSKRRQFSKKSTKKAKKVKERPSSCPSDSDSLPDLMPFSEFYARTHQISPIPNDMQNQSSHSKKSSTSKKDLIKEKTPKTKKIKKVPADISFTSSSSDVSSLQVTRHSQTRSRVVSSSNTLLDDSVKNSEQKMTKSSSDILGLLLPNSEPDEKYEVDFLQSIKDSFSYLTKKDLTSHIRKNVDYFRDILQGKIFNDRHQKFRVGPNVPFHFSSEKYVYLVEDYELLIELVTDELRSVISQTNEHLSVITYSVEVIIPELLKKVMLTFPSVKEKGISTDEECEEIMDYMMVYLIDQENQAV